MASPITLKGLDEIVRSGATLHFVGVGTPGSRPQYWIAVALPSEGDKAYVLVSSNSPSIRTLKHADAILNLVERYPDLPHIQASLLPLVAAIQHEEDIYALGKEQIKKWDPPLLDC